MQEKILKYPRTPHLSGSRLQEGDEDLSQIPFSSLKGKQIVIEEKIDGANVGISFSAEGDLLLQSRGHYLLGGSRERDYDLFKLYASSIRDTLYCLLGKRYIMYGEWMLVKHKIFYDELPHYFMEFDIFDRERGVFLDTGHRRALLEGSPIHSVPVLYEGPYTSERDILSCLTRSLYISDNHRENLTEAALEAGLDPAEVLLETENSRLAEGLYLKVESDGQVIERMKYVRYGYVQAKTSEERWLSRPIVKNRLREGAVLLPDVE